MNRGQVLGLLGAAAASARPVRALAQTPTPLRVAAALADSLAEAFYAQDQGFLSRAGIAAEIDVFNNGSMITAALIGNALDVGLTDLPQIANAVERGIPLAVIAGSSLCTSVAPITLLCVGKDGPIRTAKDMEGGTLGVGALHSHVAAASLEWLRLNGADLSKVKVFELPVPQMGPELVHGTIQAAALNEPFIAYNRDQLRILAKPMDLIAKIYPSVVWFTTRERAATDGPLLRRFTNAMYDTARWANAHPADTLEILARRAKLDIDRVRTMNRAVWATTLDPRILQPMLDFGVRFQLIDRPIAAADLIVSLPA